LNKKDNSKKKKEFTEEDIKKLLEDYEWIMSGSY